MKRPRPKCRHKVYVVPADAFYTPRGPRGIVRCESCGMYRRKPSRRMK